ncbi:MAG: prepilin-type N-terminal cleavage/methylation domain-containing protein [Candidatus Omnitrophica bacterium]|nr:prepilin-type N-terminal cleavage/methylation domain-containing protein [Candidatus Omnitrophota bacterium]
MENGKWRMENGFSLIEVILALAILILGLVGVILLFPVGLRASRQASVLSEETLVAQSRLEEIKTFGYEEIDVMEGAQGNFKWAISLEEVAPEGVVDPSGLRKAIVMVTWNQGGQEKKDSFVTMVAR